MENITEYLRNIRSAIFGKDVRESIAKAIEQTYEDATESGNANMEVIDARGSYGTLKKRLDGDKTNLQSQINGLASGSPLVASSVSEMTDTSRVYVNTSDGHWYTYNGSAWVSGGVYQGTEYTNNKTDYNSVFNKGSIDNFSNVLAWNGAEVSGNKNIININTENDAHDNEGAFICLNNYDIDKTNLYIEYESNNLNIDLLAYLYDGNNQIRQLKNIFANSLSNKIWYFIGDVSSYADPRILIYLAKNNIIQLTNVKITSYNPKEFNVNLTDSLMKRNTDYNNLIQNQLQTDLGKWSSQLWGNNQQLQPISFDSFLIRSNNNKNSSRGITSPIYNDFSKNLIIEFDCDIPNYYFPRLFIAKNQGTDFTNFEAISETSDSTDTHKKFIVNLQYYRVYKNFTQFCIWLFVNTSLETSNPIAFHKFTNFKFYWSDIDDLDIYANNFNDFVKKTQNAINNIQPTVSANNYLQGIGNKYFVQVGIDGNLQLINVIPSKVLFIGNSLLLGNNSGDYAFGMCASNQDSDYYHYITEFIKSKNQNATFSRLHSSTYEGATSLDTVTNWLNNTLLPLLDNDLDLVILQTGDNSNTTEKQQCFETSCQMVIEFIRTHATNCRVVVVGEWYRNSTVMQIMQKACENTGSQFIDISGLNTSENQGYIGQVVTFPDGSSYTVSDSGVASHPGDAGMKAIADKILLELGLMEEESE